MAIHNANGISVNVTRSNKTLSLVVMSQSAQATKLIKDLDVSVDGWSLKTNNFPNINATEKAIYLRGANTARDNDIATKTFDSVEEAKEAEKVIPKLLAKVVAPAYAVVNGDKVTKASAAWAVSAIRNLYRSAEQNGESCLTALHRLVTALRGPDEDSALKKTATTKIRQGVFGHSVAQTLKVTGKDDYSSSANWAKGTLPPKTTNEHFQEHVNQAWDVLDKASA